MLWALEMNFPLNIRDAGKALFTLGSGTGGKIVPSLPSGWVSFLTA